MKHKFVKNIPEFLEDGIIYISIDYSTVAHKCCCGCGNEIITPLSPTDWQLIFDGETISLYPSIGNWNLLCKSHYWITNNRIEWSKKWTDKKIYEGRHLDNLNKKRHYNKRQENKKMFWRWWK
ncbi:MAG: DUF6527 family protein [bacterium]